MQLWNEDGSVELVDPSIKSSISTREVAQWTQVGLLWVQDRTNGRLTMGSVVFMLVSDTIVHQVPKLPPFFLSRKPKWDRLFPSRILRVLLQHRCYWKCRNWKMIGSHIDRWSSIALYGHAADKGGDHQGQTTHYDSDQACNKEKWSPKLICAVSFDQAHTFREEGSEFDHPHHPPHPPPLADIGRKMRSLLINRAEQKSNLPHSFKICIISSW